MKAEVITKDTIFKSITYGDIALKDIPFKLNEFYKANKHYGTPFNIVVGTDSQNHSDTKIVTVVAIICEGHGGIFFNYTSRIDLIENIKEKLNHETGDSLITATELINVFEANDELTELYIEAPISIHIDAGNSKKGKTYVLVKDLVGWVTATGFDCKIKPNSFVASSIADKISK